MSDEKASAFPPVVIYYVEARGKFGVGIGSQIWAWLTRTELAELRNQVTDLIDPSVTWPDPTARPSVINNVLVDEPVDRAALYERALVLASRSVGGDWPKIGHEKRRAAVLEVARFLAGES